MGRATARSWSAVLRGAAATGACAGGVQEVRPRSRGFATDGGDNDPYKVLGVSREASELEIKRAFIARAKEAHPDTHRGTQAEFVRLMRAFESVCALRIPPPPAEPGYPDPDGLRARWYYDHVFRELDPAKVREVQQAAAMQQGGPDMGGMWMMAQMLAAEESPADQVADYPPEGQGGGGRGGREGGVAGRIAP